MKLPGLRNGENTEDKNYGSKASEKVSHASNSLQESHDQGKDAVKQKIGATRSSGRDKWDAAKGAALDTVQAAREGAEKIMEEGGPPPLFQDISKPAKDLLNKGFTWGPSLAVTTTPMPGVCFTGTGTKDDEMVTGLVTSLVQMPPYKAQLVLGSPGLVIGSVTGEQLFNQEGLSASLESMYPDVRENAKAKLTLTQPRMSLVTSISRLSTNPEVESAVTFGTGQLCAGAAMRYDTHSQAYTRRDAAFSLATGTGTSVSAVVDLMGPPRSDIYILQKMSPDVSVGMAVSGYMGKSDKPPSVSAVASMRLDEQTSVKGRVSGDGRVAGVMQHEFMPSSTISISGEVDTKSTQNNNSKVGVSISIMSV